MFTDTNNSIFSNDALGDRGYSELLQLASSYHTAAPAPDPETFTFPSDRNFRPLMYDSRGNAVQASGVVVTYPNTSLTIDPEADYDAAPAQAGDAVPQYETLCFNLTYSCFNFTCGSWQNSTREDLDNATEYVMSYSPSDTLSMASLPTTPRTTPG